MWLRTPTRMPLRQRVYKETISASMKLSCALFSSFRPRHTLWEGSTRKYFSEVLIVLSFAISSWCSTRSQKGTLYTLQMGCIAVYSNFMEDFWSFGNVNENTGTASSTRTLCIFAFCRWACPSIIYWWPLGLVACCSHCCTGQLFTSSPTLSRLVRRTRHPTAVPPFKHNGLISEHWEHNRFPHIIQTVCINHISVLVKVYGLWCSGLRSSSEGCVPLCLEL